MIATVQIDYTQLVYWQTICYIVLTLAFVGFVVPSKRHQQKAYSPNGLYLVFVTIFFFSYGAELMLTTAAFQDSFSNFLELIFVLHFMKLFILIFLLQIRDVVLNWFVLSPYQSIQNLCIHIFPSFCCFLVVCMQFLSDIQDYKYSQKNFLQWYFSRSQTFESVLLIVCYVINLLEQQSNKSKLTKKISQIDDNFKQDYLNFYHQEASITLLGDQSMSLLVGLQHNTCIIAYSFLIVSEIFNIIKDELWMPIYHLVFPLQLVAAIVLFGVKRGVEEPKTLADVLLNPILKKPFLVFSQQITKYSKLLSFLKQKSSLQEQDKEQVRQLLNEYLVVGSNCVFSQQTISNVMEQYVNKKQDIFLIAEQEAIDIIQNQAIQSFLKSMLGNRLIAFAAYTNQLTTHLMAASLLKADNQHLIYQLIDDMTCKENQCDIMIKFCHELISCTTVSQTDKNKLQQLVTLLNTDYMKFASYIKKQEYQVEQYQNMMIRMIGKRPYEKLLLNQKELYESKQLSYQDKSFSENSNTTMDSNTTQIFEQREVNLISIQVPVQQKQLSLFKHLPDGEKLKLRRQMIEEKDIINFNEYGVQQFRQLVNPLYQTLLTVLDLLNLFEELDLPPQGVKQFCDSVEQYNDNNISDLCLNLQYCFCFMSSMKTDSLKEKKDWLTPLQQLAFILVACTHILDKSGFNDNQVIEMQHAISIIYNDRAPNQKYCAIEGWQNLKNSALLANLSQDQCNLLFVDYNRYICSLESKNFYRLMLSVEQSVEKDNLFQLIMFIGRQQPTLRIFDYNSISLQIQFKRILESQKIQQVILGNSLKLEYDLYVPYQILYFLDHCQEPGLRLVQQRSLSLGDSQFCEFVTLLLQNIASARADLSNRLQLYADGINKK